MTQQEIFRQKVNHYLTCYVDHCPLHERCLRWLVGREGATDPLSVNSVNPLHPDVGTDQCPMFRQNTVVQHARGMVHFYDEMPGRKEVAIKGRLIGKYGRRQYYEYRNGVRLISPQMQQDIARICQEEGWTATLRYDTHEDDYLW